MYWGQLYLDSVYNTPSTISFVLPHSRVFYFQDLFVKHYGPYQSKKTWMSGVYAKVQCYDDLPTFKSFSMDCETWGEILEMELARWCQFNKRIYYISIRKFSVSGVSSQSVIVKPIRYISACFVHCDICSVHYTRSYFIFLEQDHSFSLYVQLLFNISLV